MHIRFVFRLVFQIPSFVIFLCLLIVGSDLIAGDTLKVMVYNVLQYPSSSSYITKNGYLETIVRHAKPHVLGINELNPPASNADLILNQVLKPSLSATFTRAEFTNTGGSPVANMLYYDFLIHSAFHVEFMIQPLCE